jgi:hypothetical protein
MSAKSGNWIVNQRSSRGPLDDKQVRQLALDFDLSEEDLRELSLNIAFALSDTFLPLGILEYSQQLKKGPSELEKLIKEMQQAEARLARAVDLFKLIEIRYPKVGHPLDDPNYFYKSTLDDTLRNVKLINSSLARSSKKYSSRFTGEPDKRHIRDERRGPILMAIFQTWHAAGRKVSVTTQPGNSKRTGPLVDFTNAVVSSITDPVTVINGETIWKTIKFWRRLKKLQEATLGIDP